MSRICNYFISQTCGCRFGCWPAVWEEVVAPGGAEGLPGTGGEELSKGGGGIVQLEEGQAEGVQGEGGAPQPRGVGGGAGRGRRLRLNNIISTTRAPAPPAPSEAEVEAQAGGSPGTRATRS